MGNNKIFFPELGQGAYCWSEGCSNIDYKVYSHIGSIGIGSRNVEGLTDVKIRRVIDYMVEFSIGVMCLQEARKSKSDVFVEECGLLKSFICM